MPPVNIAAVAALPSPLEEVKKEKVHKNSLKLYFSEVYLIWFILQLLLLLFLAGF